MYTKFIIIHYEFLLMVFIYIFTHKNETRLAFTGGITNE
ncbi:hypothetical protein IC1_04198 [Bacillus cereus VD022]|uniref:Uncharacterized protein n=1 Tax=Bacillus cereus TIAC219 TaxID=718222 RepID=A0ABC9SY01_BACCE|nr:hypothetical protein IC1_04198 [Bacillus cereus VD022]EOQ62469.1 hypothetical protein IAY_01384 [Bacillus cereus TIAC219]